MAKIGWAEPAAVVRAKRDCLGQRRGAAFYAAVGGVVFLGFAALGAASYFMHGRVWTGSWGGVAAVATGFGLAAGGVLYLVNERMGADVALSEQGVSRKRFESFALVGEAWLWEDLARCAMARVEAGGRDYPVLVLHGKSGGAYPIGMSEDRAAKVRAWFADNGRALDPDRGGPAQGAGQFLSEPLAPSRTGAVQI